MKSSNFAFVLGGATVLALVLALCLSSCGSDGKDGIDGTCSCDWYAEYYGECVDACSAAREWGQQCGHAPMSGDCVQFLWYNGEEPSKCEMVATCYRTLTEQSDCLDTMDRFKEDGWQPPTWNAGCPAE